MAEDPLKYFRIESRELIEQLSRGALELEKNGSADVVARLLRQAHTLKGAARVVRQFAIADCAHAIEDALAPYRDGQALPDAQCVSAVLSLVDQIAAHVEQLVAPAAPAPASAAPAAVAGEERPVIVRAEQAEMDLVIEGVAETAAHLGSLQATAQQIELARQLADLLLPQLVPDAARHDRGAERRHDVMLQLRDTLRQCERELAAGLQGATRELAQVRDATEQLRLVPASSLFTLLERTARDAGQALGKRVAFEARGGELRLDATVLSVLQGALVQLVRNAVAHGIESEPERRAARKPAAGHVTIEIVRRGRRAVFTCSDDGRGLDVDAIRRVARSRGIAVADTQDASAMLAVLLRGGISTTAQVTEVAGRGIGLDVVRAAVERIGGDVRVDTRRGAGTAFELSVPIDLAKLEVLAVEVGKTAVLLPLDAIRETRVLSSVELSHGAAGESLATADATIPVLRLASVLDADPDGALARRARAIVIMASGDRRVAIAVDRLAGTSTAVVRPIPEVADVDPLVAGAALDAHGVPQLVLDVEALIEAARVPRPAAREVERTRVPVLVIDDSLTTRMLEKSILEAAGYDVDTAVSAGFGLEAARRKTYALILVDVEMPGMDGFTFVERIRADPALRDTPAILVTSRSSASDRLRGEQAGAQGYIVKSEFDQADLLARIQRLVRSHA